MSDIERLEGFHVGLLSEPELAEFNRLVEVGSAYRSYEGIAGALGLAKVRFIQRDEKRSAG